MAGVAGHPMWYTASSLGRSPMTRHSQFLLGTQSVRRSPTATRCLDVRKPVYPYNAPTMDVSDETTEEEILAFMKNAANERAARKASNTMK